MHPAVSIRPFADHDVEPAMVLNNANIPELNELDHAEVARLAALAEAALIAEVLGDDGQSRFAGFCWVLGPGQPYASLNYGWFSRQYSDFITSTALPSIPTSVASESAAASTPRWSNSSRVRILFSCARSMCVHETKPR